MNIETIIEKFKDQDIAFDLFNGDLMVNATEMAKPFGKRVDNFTRLKSTKKFIQILSKDQDFRENIQSNYLTSEGVTCNFTDEEYKNFVIKTIEGQFHSGTYMCEELAIAFASWLSPEFHVWVTKMIRKIIFGNNSNEVRKAVIGLPQLFIEVSPLRVELKNLKATILGKERSEEYKELVNDHINVLSEIKSLSFRATNPTLWDSPEELGKELMSLANRRDELQVMIDNQAKEQDELLQTEEYLTLDSKVSALNKQMRDFSKTIRKSKVNPNDN